MKEQTDILEEIIPMLAIKTNFKEIEELLCANSNLPGPRGNLTLAYNFAACFQGENLSDDLLDLLIRWVNIPEAEAPANHPREYLPFCGILSLGAHYCYTNKETQHLILYQFKSAMNDKRWRTREGAAMGLQLIAENNFPAIKEYFIRCYPDASYLEKRAFVAALAHPPILHHKEIARFSLKMGGDILADFAASDPLDRRSEHFAVLSKGLQYALSVFVEALPEEGFALLKEYAVVRHPEVDKILRSNLSKSRLTKKYAPQVAEVLAIMEARGRC
ncbi:hypothetical protein [Paenibacillus lutimineralis]|uniref:HEAT repeat domain-containing protein n=1 Tax=Paenibacillus lutimineralis TaxID=2707005 RepID=A0A3S9V1K2_9BACL|nr:hypothetical protein [Paenibacillus lutimineralis]AZS16438.1 hypothetical protein EI981_19600 [Paenibacillus lutimineralis]